MIQLFKSSPDKEYFTNFIQTHCHKERNYYKLNNDIYKQMVFKNIIQDFFNEIRPHYHISKQIYLDRKMTYTRFITIIRHICKKLDITYTSVMKYSNSTYQIDYLIYYKSED